MYDWAHGLEDSIENITHSICTLEFEDHRPLYDWYLICLNAYHPQQIESARLNINFTVLSKRKLKKLVDEKHVEKKLHVKLKELIENRIKNTRQKLLSN